MKPQTDNQAWVNVLNAKELLRAFFNDNEADLAEFGRTVNQVFEAFVFAHTAKWYRHSGWGVEFKHPRTMNPGSKSGELKEQIRLKFSTRGRPSNYSFAVCNKGQDTVEIRHQLRVQTRASTFRRRGHADTRCNMVLDVAVISHDEVVDYSTDDSIPNELLVTFGEAKHMSGFAELIASFIGMVHELQPHRLGQIRTKHYKSELHPAPFLFLSGMLYQTGEAIVDSAVRRKYDIDIYTRAKMLADNFGTNVLSPRR